MPTVLKIDPYTKNISRYRLAGKNSRERYQKINQFIGTDLSVCTPIWNNRAMIFTDSKGIHNPETFGFLIDIIALPFFGKAIITGFHLLDQAMPPLNMKLSKRLTYGFGEDIPFTEQSIFRTALAMVPPGYSTEHGKGNGLVVPGLQTNFNKPRNRPTFSAGDTKETKQLIKQVHNQILESINDRRDPDFYK